MKAISRMIRAVQRQFLKIYSWSSAWNVSKVEDARHDLQSQLLPGLSRAKLRPTCRRLQKLTIPSRSLMLLDGIESKSSRQDGGILLSPYRSASNWSPSFINDHLARGEPMGSRMDLIGNSRGACLRAIDKRHGQLTWNRCKTRHQAGLEIFREA